MVYQPPPATPPSHLLKLRSLVLYNVQVAVKKWRGSPTDPPDLSGEFTMAIREILVYPDARLRQRCTSVQQFDASLHRLIDDMAETMYAAPGIGLAAIQVNVLARVVVMDLSVPRDQLQVFVNPQLTVRDATVIANEEGCLSVPGVSALVARATRVTIAAQDRDGKPFTCEAEQLLAVCIQHEVDHLDGKVFVDYLSRLKQARIHKLMIKELRATQRAA